MIATGKQQTKAINNQNRFGAQVPLTGLKAGELTWVGGKLITSDPNARHYVNDGYLGNDTVYAINSITARKFATIPGYLYEIKNQKALKRYKALISGDMRVPGAIEKMLQLKEDAFGEVDENNKLAKLLAKPNDNDSAESFKEKAYLYKAITGGAPIYVNRGGVDNGEPLELENLPGQYLQIQGDGTLFGVSKYVILTTNISLDKSEVVYWKYPNLDFHPSGYHLYGLSPLRAAAMILQSSNDGIKAMVAMFQNGGARGILFDDGGVEALTPTEMNRLQDTIDYKINNQSAKGRVVGTATRLGYINIGLDAVDMELLKAMDLSSDRLCNVYGFPPGLLNPNTTYDNRNADMKYLITNKIVYECNSFASEINNRIIPMYNGKMDNYYYCHDISDLPEMQEDFEKLSNTLVNATWLTDNEKRARTRYEQIDLPEFNTAWKNNNQIPIKEAFEGLGSGLKDDVIDEAKNIY